MSHMPVELNHTPAAIDGQRSVVSGQPGELREPKWHVLWVRSHWEQQVHDHLAEKGFHLFLPRMDTWARRNGTRYRTSVPMFPGYVFVSHAMDKAAYIEVRKTTGIVKLLGEQWDRLAIVPDREIQAIQKIHNSRMTALPHPYLREGQWVRITGGLLADVEGILLRTKPNKGLLVVSVDLLQRSVAVEVDCTLVVPA
jgi:transcription antitermination factor NusG